MPDSDRKLHAQCPGCGANKDFDTPVARHYTCGAYGSFSTGKYRPCSANAPLNVSLILGTLTAPERTLQ